MQNPFLSNKRCNPRHQALSRGSRLGLGLVLASIWLEPVLAEVLNNSTPLIRIRLGDNARGGTNTVVYNARIPAALGGLPGVAATPDTVSTTAISGGSGVFRVRIVTDLNARNGLNRLAGEFSYDSSAPLTCVSAATCGTETINFDRIRWTVRDGDTHAAVTQFDGTANQVTQVQRDTNPANNRDNTRHRNYFEYVYDNALLLPAGTYEGTITINGVGIF